MKKVFLSISLLILLLPGSKAQQPNFYVVDTFPVIYTFMEQVDTAAIHATIQHLQDYGTRNCKKPQAWEAQNWIRDQFLGCGLPVEIQDVTMGGTDCSDNVIATLTGHIHPDEYVILGGHYDSFSITGDAPGADDNASGTAGVMEVARILSQYSFERTLVFCAFSAEEYGLYGSEAYAARAENQEQDILGYFNMDMTGYHYWPDVIHTKMMAPPSCQELSDFYKAVCAIYLPDFPVIDATVIPGGSDHQSFISHGYMGIFPAEEDVNYSPYIHTPNDKIGNSVNSFEKAGIFTQAALASVVSLARPVDSTVSVVNKRGKGSRISLYPNPAEDVVHIRIFPETRGEYEVCSTNGRTIFTGTLNRETLLDVSSLPSGIYLVRVQTHNSVITGKLVKS